MKWRITQLAMIYALGLLGLSGCASARYVTVTASNTSGVVAIPENTNVWPHYYRKQAEELMQAKCPDGYVVEHECQVVKSSNRQLNAEPIECSEWRIYFMRADAPPGSALALMPKFSAGDQPLIGQAAFGLTPATPGVKAPTVIGSSPSLPGARAGTGQPSIVQPPFGPQPGY